MVFNIAGAAPIKLENFKSTSVLLYAFEDNALLFIDVNTSALLFV